MNESFLIHEYGSEFYLPEILEGKGISIKIDAFNHHYLRSGRDAIGVVASALSASYETVLMPAFCCSSMVAPFSNFGFNVVYYKLNKNMTINLHDLYRKISHKSVLIYIDYFGKDVGIKDTLQTIKNTFDNIPIIEDRTHDIFSEKIYAIYPDYIVSSLRKWLPLPSGGMLFSKNSDIKVPDDSFFSTIRSRAMNEKFFYLKTGKIELKNQYRELLRESENYISHQKNLATIDHASRKILETYDVETMKLRRQNNFLFLWNTLDRNNGLFPLFDSIPECPLYFPVLTEDRDHVQSMLAQKNIYCPVIWPLPEAAGAECPVSREISSRILAIPCDQRYDESDMKYICDAMHAVLSQKGHLP